MHQGLFKPIRRRSALLLGLACLAQFSLVGCDDGGPTYRDVRLVGDLEGGAYVALVADEDDVVVYACDGVEDDATFSVWLLGAHEDGAFSLVDETSGASVSGQFDDVEASGTLTLKSGEQFVFDVLFEGEDTGIYMFEDYLNGDPIRGGWIVRDGGMRGAVISRTTGDLVTGSSVSQAELSVTLMGFSFNLSQLQLPMLMDS